jgi:hypothetical protein
LRTFLKKTTQVEVLKDGSVKSIDKLLIEKERIYLIKKLQIIIKEKPGCQITRCWPGNYRWL